MNYPTPVVSVPYMRSTNKELSDVLPPVIVAALQDMGVACAFANGNFYVPWRFESLAFEVARSTVLLANGVPLEMAGKRTQNCEPSCN